MDDFYDIDMDFAINRELNEKMKKELKDLPLQININLYVTQEQHPELTNVNDVERAAIAMKESNAVEDTRDSAIAQEKSNAADHSINKSSSIEKKHQMNHYKKNENNPKDCISSNDEGSTTYSSLQHEKDAPKGKQNKVCVKESIPYYPKKFY